MFDDVAAVVLNWLKKHVYPSYLNEVRREEEEEEEAERKEKEEAELAAKAKEEEAAKSAAAAIVPPPIPPKPQKKIQLQQQQQQQPTSHGQPSASGTSDAPQAQHPREPPPVNRAIRRPSVPHDESATAAANAVAASADQPLASSAPSAGAASVPLPSLSPSASFNAAIGTPSPLAPLPLLHNVSGDSFTLAKSGGHVPDFSSSASPTNSINPTGSETP